MISFGKSTKKSSIHFLLVISALTFAAVFQNCSKVKFSEPPSRQVESLGSHIDPLNVPAVLPGQTPVCTPNSSQSCVDSQNIGSGTQTCKADGSGFNLCQLSSCSSGYYPANGACILNVCTAGDLAPCSDSVGTGLMTCQGDGASYGTCVYASCTNGITPKSGSCVSSGKWSYKVVYDRYNTLNCQGPKTWEAQNMGYYGTWNGEPQKTQQECETARQQHIATFCDIPDEYGPTTCSTQGVCYSGNVIPTGVCEELP